MNVASPTYTSFEAYLEAEASSDVKHEWCDGVVYAMSRGTPEHARLTARMIQVLGAALAKPCVVFASDVMLYIETANLSTYADVSVVCGPLRTKTVHKNGCSLGEAVTNPTILVEILSAGTERYDRDGKFQAYKQLASLREYVLVHQDKPCVEVYRLENDTWSCETADGGGKVTIHGATIAINSVYE